MLQRGKKYVYTGYGFTLVEMLVSIGIFIVVILMSTGALVTLADGNRKVQSARVAIDNLDLALQEMSREIRMGTHYHCDTSTGTYTQRNSCESAGANSFTFLNQNGDQVTYRLSGTRIQKAVGDPASAQYSDITASNIEIAYLDFYVDILESSSEARGKVVISTGGTAGVPGNTDTTFNIQFAVAERTPEAI